jgi:hypothetical protein
MQKPLYNQAKVKYIITAFTEVYTKPSRFDGEMEPGREGGEINDETNCQLIPTHLTL